MYLTQFFSVPVKRQTAHGVRRITSDTRQVRVIRPLSTMKTPNRVSIQIAVMGSTEKTRQLMVCRFAWDSCAAALCVRGSKSIRGPTSLNLRQKIAPKAEL